MSPSDAIKSSNNSTSTNGASLRPRTRRLISDLDDDTPTDAAISRPSSAGTRNDSGRSTPRRHERFEAMPAGRNAHAATGSHILTGTWNQISGFAAGILSGQSRNNSPLRRTDPRRSMPPTAAAKSDWGPQLQHHDLGSGSNDTRAALLRDAKRKALLSGNDNVANLATRHKRRTSDDIPASFRHEENPELESLVYVHHVKPGDTLPGLTIKYNCQAAALRKANRIWPNDPIQSRKIIYIPVDASSIKGRPVPGPEVQIEEDDLLGDYTENIMQHESPQLSRSPRFGSSAFQDSIPAAPLSPASTTFNLDSEYKHDSWVLLPNDKKPTEVARLFRQSLGFFPRARRKSIGFSDRSTSRNTSFDLGRTVQSSPLIRPQDTVPEISSPSRPSLSTRSSQPSRTRSSSNPVSSLLRGPGGVGTMGRNVRTIGPGNERLTERFGAYLPSVAPPIHQTVFTPWTPSLIPESENYARTAVDANGVPINSGASIDLQDVGGAIEGWVRKFAKKASTALETTPSTSTTRTKGKTNPGAEGLGLSSSGMGDLIELVDALEVGEEGQHPPSEPLPSIDLSSPSKSVAKKQNTTVISSAAASNSVKAWSGASGEVRGRKISRNPDES